MKNFLKIIPWALVLALVLFIWANRDKASPGPIVKAPVNTELPIQKRYIDSAGNQHVVALDDQNKVTKEYMKGTDRPKNIIDTAASNLKIATAMIQKLTQINTLTKDSLLKARRQVNNLTKQITYLYKDKFVDLAFTPPADTSGNGTFAFAYNADLTIVQYQKRNWFLGQKRSYIDISSNDKRTTIKGLKQLTVEQKTPQYGLRVQMNGNYNINYKSFGFGPAIRLDVGRFSLQGNYSFYPESSNWVKSVNVNYDIVRF